MIMIRLRSLDGWNLRAQELCVCVCVCVCRGPASHPHTWSYIGGQLGKKKDKIK
jgi:hypothetical protein